MANAVRCDTCRKLIHPATEQRPVNGVVSVGFECPSCKTWYHGYWHSDELERYRQTIEAMTPESLTKRDRRKIVRKRLESYQKAFDRLQKRMTAGAT